MVRADLHFAQGSMRPAAKHVKVGTSGSPPHFPGNDCSAVYPQPPPPPSPSLKNSSVARWGPLRDNFQRPGHLITRKPSDSKYSRPSLDASNAQPREGIKRISLHSRRANTDPMSYDQSWNSSDLRQSYDLGPAFDGHDCLPRKTKGVKTKVNIKPLLRKISRDDARPTSLDLSRSSLEYEGLGIYTNFEHERHQGDHFGGNSIARRTASGLHNRSISEASQFSAARSPTVSKRSSYNFHPRRQAPSAYTPPLSQSYQTSSGESDGSGDTNPFSLERESATLSRSDSFHPVKPSSLSLQTHNDGSFSKSLGGHPSSVTGRHSFGYSRDHDSNTLDSPSPISRSSLDFVFRPKQRASTDPISRAAAVQAARKAFEEKEAAKAQKFERHQMKAEERQMRRREKQQWWRTSTDDQIERNDMDMGNVDLESSISEKSSDLNVPENDNPPLPPQTRTASWKSQSKDTWMLFVTWLRTRLFKLRRNLRKLQ